jgi:hypothetical protein
VPEEFIKSNYDSDQQHVYWMKWLEDTKRLEVAIEKDVWNKKPNFTCRGHCPVVECEHWEPKKH